MGDGTALLVALALLLANAFFVGAEFALISARRTQIEPLAAAGSRRARVTLWAMERVSLMMAGAQLGITLCSLGLGAIGEPAVAHLLEPPFERLGVPEHLLHPIAFVVAMTIVVVAHVVIGEMVTKNLALALPDRTALLLGPPLAWLIRASRPFIMLLNGIANLVLRLMGVRPQDEVASTYTRDQVAELVAESQREGLLEPEEHRLVTGALAFADRTVQTVAIALDRVVSVRLGITPAELEALAGRTGYSRFPVLAQDGEITGYLHLKDVLEDDAQHRDRPVAHTWVRVLPEVRTDDRLPDVVGVLRDGSAHLARVVDEQGRTTGLVTLDDVLAALVFALPAKAASAQAHPESALTGRQWCQ